MSGDYNHLLATILKHTTTEKSKHKKDKNKFDCDICNDDGEYDCNWCDDGEVEQFCCDEEYCDVCDSEGYYYETCDECCGSGYIICNC